MKRFLTSAFAIVCMQVVFGQGNVDRTKGSIQIDLPKTPESQSFEKYGTIPVDEYSGVPSISIPLFTVKSRSLIVPASLSYHASGIKVNQEATWVGLGWDLSCGGRITIDVKGNVDELVRSSITNGTTFKDGMRRIFNKWRKPYGPYGNAANNNPKVGYAFIDYGKAYASSDTFWHANDTLWDEPITIAKSAWEGAGEPDIFHATFLGNSVDFYVDLVADQVRFIGEKSMFHVAIARSSEQITSIIITDNAGTQYYFEQKEITHSEMPSGYSLYWTTESPSAWLLTKIKKDDDVITFSYTNFGDLKPAYTWSQSISATMINITNDPGDTRQNQITQYPYYLSKIESSSTVVDFSFGSRVDIDGTGARTLDKIEVKDKSSGTVIHQYNFNYDYFVASAQASDTSLPDIKKKRLRLLSLTRGANNDAPWKFYYNTTPGPNKYSFAQDHWGFYNGANSNESLVPNYNDPEFAGMVSRNINGYYFDAMSNGSPIYEWEWNSPTETTIPTSFQGTGYKRSSDSLKMLAYTLDSIVYPTGGSTKYEFEAHRSYFPGKNIVHFTGGGLRVKAIKNYALNNVLENSVEYDYQNSGIYLGHIEYLKVWTKAPGGNSISLSAWGTLNDNSQNVGYGTVKKTLKNALGGARNGFEIKYFHTSGALFPELVYAPQPYPLCSWWNGNYVCPQVADPVLLYMGWLHNEPTQKRDRDGKMYKSEIYDSTGTLVHSSEYFYRQAGFTNNFYSLRAEDNYVGYVNSYGNGTNDAGNADRNRMPWRRWMVTLYPAPSYYTVLDSLIEKQFVAGGSSLSQKKTYRYNYYGQMEYEAASGSDGSEIIQYLKTPLSYQDTTASLRYHPSIPPGTFAYGNGDALEIERMKGKHIYEAPIETITLKRMSNGDTVVLSAGYKQYDWGILKKSFALENASPLTWRSQFIPAFYSGTSPNFSMTVDNQYKLQDSAEYFSSNLVKSISNRQGRNSYLWDDSTGNIIATCIAALPTDIAFTSFEVVAKGNWAYSGLPSIDGAAPTGVRSYSLSNGNITKSDLSTSKAYVVSYWSKNGAQSVNSTSATSGRSVGGYTYYEHRVPNPSGGVITVSGTGTIDELRLYPMGSIMTTYTYKALKGVRTICDANNRISYYEYDDLGRLYLVRDQDRNILKKICYNYAGQPENCNPSNALWVKQLNTSSIPYTISLTNTTTSAVTSYSVYPNSSIQQLGQIAEGVYNVSIAPMYGSSTSVKLTYNGAVQTGTSFSFSSQNLVEELSFALEPDPNAACSFTMNSGFSSPSNGISKSGSTVSMYIVFYSTSTMSPSVSYNIGTVNGGCRPSITRTVSFTSGGRSWTITISPSGQMTASFYGSSASPYTTISGTSLSYNL